MEYKHKPPTTPQASLACHMHGRWNTDTHLLLHLRVASGCLDAVMDVGVASHLHRQSPKPRFIDKGGVIQYALGSAVPIEELHNGVATGEGEVRKVRK